MLNNFDLLPFRNDLLQNSYFPYFKPSFKEYGFDDRLLSALVRIGIKIPTNIQFDALPLLLSGKSGLIASETGNGKTVAFLLPTLQKILNSYEVSPDLTNRQT